ncbi:2491_t:CDS:2 [Paraglomus occultum]|uniref:2491_t:CDS:1 n=1 Tax=Paraglomus occultum TaxID=144539 RepID=A0A9N9AGW6_9GLOM|nr:2491_t:CDS:2 [Paraglomus occultum]
MDQQSDLPHYQPDYPPRHVHQPPHIHPQHRLPPQPPQQSANSMQLQQMQPHIHQQSIMVDHPPHLALNPTPSASISPFSFHSGSSNQNHNVVLDKFWHKQLTDIANLDHDFKNHPLPLARIKKVMKVDEDVKMISSEAPVIFAKACYIFIIELTIRAWLNAEESKRRTLQRSDIGNGIKKVDMFDFLVDIIPRDDKPIKNEKPDHPSHYPYGYGVPHHQFSGPMSEDQKLAVDSQVIPYQQHPSISPSVRYGEPSVAHGHPSLPMPNILPHGYYAQNAEGDSGFIPENQVKYESARGSEWYAHGQSTQHVFEGENSNAYEQSFGGMQRN